MGEVVSEALQEKDLFNSFPKELYHSACCTMSHTYVVTNVRSIMPDGFITAILSIPLL